MQATNGQSPYRNPVTVDDDESNENEKAHKPDDVELGDAFVKAYAGRYAHIYGQWHCYDPNGGVWSEAKRHVRRETVTLLTSYRKQGVKVSRNKVENVLGVAELYLPPEDELPNQPDLIPLKNGVYNLRTDEFEPHKAENYFLQALDFDYDPEARCPTWDDTLNNILVTPDGKTDWDLKTFVMEMFGYALWGDNRLQASFFLHGDGGTGKSTVLEVLQALTNSKTSIDLETLNDYQIATLVDVRVAVFNEIEEGTSFPEAAFKRLVSSDQIQARHPYGQVFTFQPVCTVFGAMNTLPRVKDRSAGVFRRVYIVPFNKKVTKPDVYLPVKLMNERAGIFQWALTGLKRLRRRKHFEPPTQVVEALNEWRYENDIEKQFLESGRVVLGEEHQAVSSSLYDAYAIWCKANGNRPKSMNRVAKEWRRLGLEQVKSSSNFWRGVKINDLNDVPF